MDIGPRSQFADELHATKYRNPGESFDEAMVRIANHLKDGDEHFEASKDILRDMRFMFGGRAQSAAGSPRQVTAGNCFVSGTIDDSMDGIMQRASEAATTMRMGGGIGYDFSPLRPRLDLIKSLDAPSSGPVSFMNIYDAVCRTIMSAGNRRGAQMATLRVDHPDIEEFIQAKHNETNLTNFNTSIGVTDEFMQAVLHEAKFDLRFNDRTYKTVDAVSLWEQIMRSTWDWAEPGVLFIDTINRMNNLYYCEKIAATNPCGEQPLPPHGMCLLGSFNLTKYLRSFGGTVFFYEQLAEDIPHVVRMADNLLDRTTYPLEAHEYEAKSKRRIGLGVTGLANTIEAMGHPYGSEGFLKTEHNILLMLRNEAYMASIELAREKGAFQKYDPDYLLGNFVGQLPMYIRAEMITYGIRNSHLTSIAPTGTISLTADNVSSGIEPVFADRVDRIVEHPDGPAIETIEDYGMKFLGTRSKTSVACTADDHLNVLLTAVPFIDSAISKTCNVSQFMPWEEFKDIYRRAWEGGAKGCTTFNPGGKRFGILSAQTPTHVEEPGAACYIDPATGERSCDG
jgi:ribonucleoside-diphosphate reductase alpha chain